MAVEAQDIQRLANALYDYKRSHCKATTTNEDWAQAEWMLHSGKVAVDDPNPIQTLLNTGVLGQGQVF